MKSASRTSQQQKGFPLRLIAAVFLVFALIFLQSSCYFSGTLDDQEIRGLYPGQRVFGPVVVTEPGQVFTVSVTGTLPDMSWINIEAQLLDRTKALLLSFEGGLYHESGYDSDGNWTESNNETSIDLTIPEAGEYYFAFNSSGGWIGKNYPGSPEQLVEMIVRIVPRTGSSLPLVWSGFALLVLAVIFNELANRQKKKRLTRARARTS